MANLHDIHAPSSMSEMRDMCEQMRILFDSLYDRVMHISGELHPSLAALSGNPYLLGLDSRSAARKTVKPLIHAANLSREAARASKTSWMVYQGFYLPKQPHGARRGFDVHS